MRSRSRSLRTLPLALLLGACTGGASEAPLLAADGTESASQPLITPTAHPLLPIPQPEGMHAIGARLREYRIELTRDTVSAGELEFHVVNSGTTAHWLIVRDDTLFVGTPHLQPGDSAILKVELTPGEYNLVCTIRDEFDHISEGMRGTLVVR